jgi:hypothetical protein
LGEKGLLVDCDCMQVLGGVVAGYLKLRCPLKKAGLRLIAPNF